MVTAFSLMVSNTLELACILPHASCRIQSNKCFLHSSASCVIFAFQKAFFFFPSIHQSTEYLSHMVLDFGNHKNSWKNLRS